MNTEVFLPLNLKRARRMCGMKQDDLALKAKCSRNTVSRAERGQCSRRMAERFASILQIDPATLFTEMQNATATLTTRQKQVVDLMRSSGANAQAIWSFAMGLVAANPSDGG